VGRIYNWIAELRTSRRAVINEGTCSLGGRTSGAAATAITGARWPRFLEECGPSECARSFRG
jgi:hypothetical protein